MNSIPVPEYQRNPKYENQLKRRQKELFNNKLSTISSPDQFLKNVNDSTLESLDYPLGFIIPSLNQQHSKIRNETPETVSKIPCNPRN